MLELDAELDLVLERWLDLSPEAVWAAWTQPEWIRKWFVPAPWTAPHSEIDLRPGGIFHVLMRSPEGMEVPVRGCVLEVVEHRRLVWTDCLGPDFRPTATPFISVRVEMEPKDGGTFYRVTALHPNVEVRQVHEGKGFKDGTAVCLDQLVTAMRDWRREG